MTSKLFVNLPVRDLGRSVEFFSRLGYTFDPKFTNDKATCMILGGDNCVMLLTEPFFETFLSKPLVNAKQGTEVLLALSLDSREAVDSLVHRALDAGASHYKDPDDQGFMYSWGFEDPDGHIWEYFWMDPGAMQG